MFEVEPLTDECATAMAGATHACVGVSPFNSYFSTDRLSALARWAFEHFEHVHFFIPDSVTAYTLEAQGYSASRARQKARRQGRYTRNKVTAALRTTAIANPDDLILDMDRLGTNPRYRELDIEVKALFADDESFRAACIDATSWVLEHKLPPGTAPSRAQLDLAVRYFLAELPLFAASGSIVGAAGSIFVYHQRVRFLQRFFARELSWKPESGHGFLVVRDRESDPTDDGLSGGDLATPAGAR